MELFYEQLSAFYDYIFPAKPETVDFLSRVFGTSGRVLDVACGTGSYSISLAQRGLDVVGLDIQPEMIEKAKAKDPASMVNFVCQDMRSMNQLGCFSGIFCIGNSLAHLPTLDEVSQFVADCHQALTSGGHLVIQIVNFDRILQNGRTELPLIENEYVRFRRIYSPKNGEALTFYSELTIKKGAPERTLYNEISLRPLTSEQLRKIFDRTGFSSIQLHDGFSERTFRPKTSYGLVFTAMKQ